MPSWRRPESWGKRQERRLHADLRAEGIAATASVVPGPPAEVVLTAVEREPRSLVVLGIARDAPIDRIQLGSTVDALVRRSTVPVLNVRSRARAAYRHVVVATDLSTPSARALRVAVSWFPNARLTAFHAYAPAGSETPATAALGEARRAATEEALRRFVRDGGIPEEAAPAIECLAEQGDPGLLLDEYVELAGADLVVLGSRGKSGVARVLLGSTAERLLHTLDCDTLVVRHG